MRVHRLLPILATLLLLSLPAAYAQENFHRAAAIDYMQSKQWDFASYEWRKVLESDPKDAQAHIGLAQALRGSGYPQDAIRHLEKALPDVSDPALKVALGEMYEKAQQSGRARELYLAALQQDSLNAAAFRKLHALSQKGNTKAATTLSKNLDARAKDAEAEARAAMKDGRYTEALRHFEIAAIRDGKLRLHNDYGVVMLLAGQNRQAAQKFEQLSKNSKLWQIQANHALALLSLGNTHAAGKKAEEAIAAAKTPQEKAKLYNLLGYIYEGGKKYTSAKYAYQRAVELDPALVKAEMNLAFVQQRLEEFENAEKTYKNLLKKNPTYAEGWNKLGFVYELMYEPKRARGAYQKALEIDPKNRDAYYNLGMLYKKMEEPEKSDATLKRLMELEFGQMETGTKGSPEAPKHKLFEFVDVFFAV